MSVLRSTARTLTASAVLVGTLLAPTMVHVAAAGVAPAATLPAPATAALTWLADELADGGGATGQSHILGQTFDFGSGPTFFPDFGLTADAVMDLVLTGVRPTEATASLDNVQDHISDYVTGGSPADRYAGALGKSLLLAEITGRDPHAFGGFDLEQELRARLQTTGIKAGRFTDDAKFGDPNAASEDFSNGFGQAIDMLALTRTTGGVPASAIDFLLAQQCPGGGFRSTYDATAPATSTRGCASDSEADPDATAVALDVLITQPAATGVPAAALKAIAKLVALQDAGGGFPSAAGTLNANTTGLAGQALRSAGLTAAADKAAAFVTSLQLTPATASASASADVTPAAVPGPGDLGAIAFSVADHTAAEAAGIADAARDKFHRATTQGVLVYGITPFGVVAVPPPPPTTTTTAAVTTTTAVGATTSTTAGASTTIAASGGSTTTTTTTPAKAAGHIPVTGSDVRDLVLLGIALLAVGEIVRRSARLQGRRTRS